MVDVVTRMTCLNKDSLEDVKQSQRLSRCHARAMIRTRVQPKYEGFDNDDNYSNDIFAAVETEIQLVTYD